LVEEKVLVVGLGEVGLSLYELLKERPEFKVYGFDVDEAKMKIIKQGDPPSQVDVMHICISCLHQRNFADITVGYIERFTPSLVIINSTVPPKTTEKVYRRCKNCSIAHSPIRGMHKNREHMKWELQRWTKYVGGIDAKSSEAACRHFQKAGFKTKVLKSSVETELAKLFETTYRAWMIACFQEMHRISCHFKADFDEIVDFLEDTHRIRLDRPVMFPGVIGGHCLIPNVELLLESYSSRFLGLLKESNEKRKEEIKDVHIRREIDKVKRRIEVLEKDLTGRVARV